MFQVDTKPASDILAGAVARAASQGTIHPLDTLKVRMQTQGGLSKYAKLVPPPGICSTPVTFTTCFPSLFVSSLHGAIKTALVILYKAWPLPAPGLNIGA